MMDRWEPREYTAAEQRVIEAAARRHEDNAVAEFRRQIDRYDADQRGADA